MYLEKFRGKKEEVSPKSCGGMIQEEIHHVCGDKTSIEAAELKHDTIVKWDITMENKQKNKIIDEALKELIVDINVQTAPIVEDMVEEVAKEVDG